MQPTGRRQQQQGFSEGPFSSQLTQPYVPPSNPAADAGWGGPLSGVANIATNFLSGVAQARINKQIETEKIRERNTRTLAGLLSHIESGEYDITDPTVNQKRMEILQRLAAETANADPGKGDGQYDGVIGKFKQMASQLFGGNAPKVKPITEEEIGQFTTALPTLKKRADTLNEVNQKFYTALQGAQAKAMSDLGYVTEQQILADPGIQDAIREYSRVTGGQDIPKAWATYLGSGVTPEQDQTMQALAAFNSVGQQQPQGIGEPPEEDPAASGGEVASAGPVSTGPSGLFGEQPLNLTPVMLMAAAKRGIRPQRSFLYNHKTGESVPIMRLGTLTYHATTRQPLIGDPTPLGFTERGSVPSPGAGTQVIKIGDGPDGRPIYAVADKTDNTASGMSIAGTGAPATVPVQDQVMKIQSQDPNTGAITEKIVRVPRSFGGATPARTPAAATTQAQPPAPPASMQGRPVAAAKPAPQAQAAPVRNNNPFAQQAPAAAPPAQATTPRPQGPVKKAGVEYGDDDIDALFLGFKKQGDLATTSQRQFLRNQAAAKRPGWVVPSDKQFDFIDGTSKALGLVGLLDEYAQKVESDPMGSLMDKDAAGLRSTINALSTQFKTMAQQVGNLAVQEIQWIREPIADRMQELFIKGASKAKVDELKRKMTADVATYLGNLNPDQVRTMWAKRPGSEWLAPAAGGAKTGILGDVKLSGR